MKLKTDWIVNQSPEKEMRSYLGTEKKIPTAYKMEKVAITAGTCYENVERNKNKLLSSTYICAGSGMEDRLATRCDSFSLNSTQNEKKERKKEKRI